MTDDVIARAGPNCCRLCLAPDNECVPILTSLAADKEPLSAKIQACVNVKINQSDNLSHRICHSCISFLNSWQSFKNRCLAAQVRQTNWLEKAKNAMRRKMAQVQRPMTRNASGEVQGQSKTATGRPMPLPIVIKEEPVDEEADAREQAAMKVNLDPGQFLDSSSIITKQEEEEDDYADRSDEGPQILRSLGLTHIKKLNPFNKLNKSNDTDKKSTESGNKSSPEIPPTQCRFCNIKFSSATNARRHERNIHRSGDSNPETPKMCIKPTTARSLLKPQQTLRPQSTPIISPTKSAPTPEMMGFFDYDKPEKYRHFLTDSKLAFIRKNEEFLQQYQTMTCTCCPQTFPSYKAFMAHMRRKYANLGRNLCFRCLKQFQTKAPFVSHLKKKDCINLYKLYKTDKEMSNSATMTSPDKQGTKEMLNNKLYECKLCSKTFRLKLDFRSHVYEAHGDSIKKDASPGRCGFCNAGLDDPSLRRRHYNNMECIVEIRCGTCNEKFELHQQFTDHVYETHLRNNTNNNDSAGDIDTGPTGSANISHGENVHSRLPHSCNICGQTYNNYYNVLRHMEGKHPDQVPKRYMCDKCDAGFSRQGPLRDHMYEVHGTTLPRVRREMFSCRMCSEQIDTRERWIQHQTEQHSRYTCCFCAFQTKNLDLFKEHIENHPQLSMKNLPILAPNILSLTNGGNEGDDEADEDAAPPAKKIKIEPADFECDVCHVSFSGNVALANHKRVHYQNDDSKSVKNETSTANAAPAPELIPGDQNRRIRCHLCSKRYTSKITYRKHMLAEHKIRNVSFIKCSICKAEFTHERGLRVHLHKSHDSMLVNETFHAIYECEVCDAEFKSEKSLNQHRSMTHKKPEVSISLVPAVAVERSGEAEPVYWYQCSYCPGHFDTSKKLAIHLNVHTEHDSTDYSCKDCGNVYNGRKSLWVHRHKKHREIPDPSPCPICKKLFFSKKMLDMHVKHHSSDDQDDDAAPGMDYDAGETEHDNNETYEQPDQPDVNFTANAGVDQPLVDVKVHCTVCNEEFSDQDLFDKHMETHQIDLYSDNPLAAMFDTGPEDPNQIFMNQMSESGAYTCDICSKHFSALTALKVHRNWHFRQDGKQGAADGNSKNSAQKKKSHNVCEFCDTAFSSPSNLKRHIVEVHNRNSQTPSARAKQLIDKNLECTKCNLKFEEKTEWVKHKITHAGECSVSTFEWVCEICGKVVSRKDRLIQHLNSHMKSNADVEEEGNSRDTFGSNKTGRRSTMKRLRTGDDDDVDASAAAHGSGQITKPKDHHEDDESNAGEEKVEESDEEGGAQSKTASENRIHYDEDSSQQYQEVDPDDMEEEEDEENEPDDGVEEDDNMGSYSCDLCQVYFETSKQLRRHVTSHFLNGPGSVTLTEIPKEKSYSSQMRVGEDVVSITPV